MKKRSLDQIHSHIHFCAKFKADSIDIAQFIQIDSDTHTYYNSENAFNFQL